MATTYPKQSEFRSAMYAVWNSSTIYHLLYPDQKHTLCGCRVEIVKPDCVTKTDLHVVADVPASRTLCKHCADMNHRRTDGSLRHEE